MSAADLLSLPSHRALTTWDCETLERLTELPPDLRDLRQALLESGVKGEQEGFFDETRIAALVRGEA
jgi:hypothetical protein